MPLVQDGRAACKVVVPEDDRWSGLAHRFCVRVREYSSVEPDQVTPDQLVEDDWRTHHLVLFGSILNNPAILRLYSNHRCFTDAAYPGPGGAEIRMIADPLGAGRDVLLIGGADYDAVHDAAIGLYRSFSSVTDASDDGLRLRRLNFCVSTRNCAWLPTDDDADRIAKCAAHEPASRLQHAADAALYHYEADEAQWASVLHRLLADERPDSIHPDGAWKFALAWGLVESSPRLLDGFRAHVEAILLDVGERVASSWESPATGDSLTRVATSPALALIRIHDHASRIHKDLTLESPATAARDMFLRVDPGGASDGLRDWLAVDQWLGVLMQQERYDLLDDAPLAALAQEALATTDNLKTAIGHPDDLGHVRNVLLKIAAYLEDGDPLWIRLWLGDDPAEEPSAMHGPTASWNWYTGSYASDLLPRLPSNVDRVRPRSVSNPDDTGRLITFRQDLDRAHEYLSIQGSPSSGVPPNAIRRLTWNAESWVTGGAWERSTGPATVERAADLPGFGYVASSVSFQSAKWTRNVVWAWDDYFLLIDEWHSDDRYCRVLRADWDTGGKPVDRAGCRWLIHGDLGVLHLVAEHGATPDEWRLNVDAGGSARRATLLTTGNAAAPVLQQDGSYRIGDNQAAVGILDLGRVRIESAACLLRPRAMSLVGFRGITVSGRELLGASQAVDLHVNLDTHDCRCVADVPTRITWPAAGQLASAEIPPGNHELRLEDFDVDTLMEAFAEADAPTRIDAGR